MFLISASASAADPVIEFYNADLDHYFITASASEAGGIDDGAAGPGWHRTARVFGAYSDAATAPPDAQPVCRFYGNVAQGGPNSHFYTADAAECAAVKEDNGWTYEGIAFYVRVPVAGGACPANTTPILRNYNQRFAQHDSNHRYSADRALYDEMTAIGWSAEGTVICGDPAIATPARSAPVIASGLTTLVNGCDQSASQATLYASSEVEPFIAINPRAPDNFIGVWQQDRWSDGGAHGLVTGVSFDGGRSWQKTSAPFSRCTGGNAANGGDFRRASDPWVSFGPDGTAFQIAIVFAGNALSGFTNGVSVSRSRDGGVTWEQPVALRRDNDSFFNDKESVTADPTDARYVYAVWDRIDNNAGFDGPVWFARSVDGGNSWEPSRMIYNPGSDHATINNQIVVLPDGTLVNFFTESRVVSANDTQSSLVVIRSSDKGLTWSAPITVADVHSVGAKDPDNVIAIRDGSGLGQAVVDRQGRLFIVFQDARNTNGARDAVLITRSADGGLTWSDPAQVNPDKGVAAFIPAVAVTRDGTIGVTYYDFRNNTADRASLPADYWIARSHDGVSWTETHIDGSFDFSVAPVSEGLFLGDYQGIATVGNAFVPFYGRTNPDPANRSDIVCTFIPPPGE